MRPDRCRRRALHRQRPHIAPIEKVATDVVEPAPLRSARAEVKAARWVVDRPLATTKNAHYQINVVDDDLDYRIAVNVRPKEHPSEVAYLVQSNSSHPILAELAMLGNFNRAALQPRLVADQRIRPGWSSGRSGTGATPAAAP
jgi:hypothetical protein